MKLDTELSVDDLKALTAEFKEIYRDQTGEDFPQEPREQLRQAIVAVFDSWMGKRAVEYRRINRIPDDWGTAVNVQQMVFGNKGDTSCSGVAFSRDEITGAPRPSGDFLSNAQGEDVVSGVRTPRDLHELKDVIPEAYEELLSILVRARAPLRRHAGHRVHGRGGAPLHAPDAQRQAPGAGRGALRGRRGRGGSARQGGRDRHDRRRAARRAAPSGDRRDAEYDVLAEGVAASPGAAKGAIVFTAADAVAAAEDKRDVILVRPFTEADDVAGFHAAKGILTSEGGKASHAALVARGMGKPCVSGAAALEIDVSAKTLRVDGTQLAEGDTLVIDGSAGVVTTDDVPLEEPKVSDAFQTVLSWADELRQLGVRTNADTPEDAARAREFGAEGMGLCRTEHMFMAADRQPKMRADDHGRDGGGAARGARQAAAAPAGGLRGPVPRDARAAGDRAAARPAAPRVPAARGGRGARD